MISHHDALIYTMVLVSAADSNMPDVELTSIGDAVMHLPVFRDFDRQNLPKVTAECTKLLQDGDGLDKAFKAIKAALPEKLRETAYALACDVATACRSVACPPPPSSGDRARAIRTSSRPGAAARPGASTPIGRRRSA